MLTIIIKSVIIIPDLVYSCTAYSNSLTAAQITSLQVLQNRATRATFWCPSLVPALDLCLPGSGYSRLPKPISRNPVGEFGVACTTAVVLFSGAVFVTFDRMEGNSAVQFRTSHPVFRHSMAKHVLVCLEAYSGTKSSLWCPFYSCSWNIPPRSTDFSLGRQ